MQDIEKIDKNFKLDTEIKKDDIVFYSVLDLPFRVYGLIYENNKFRRMPEDIAKTVSYGVHCLHSNTSGGRVRFKTDSKYVAISAKMCGIAKMDHFALTGSAGFDIYVNTDGVDKFNGAFRPPFNIVDGYESVFDFDCKKMREITINFPLYSDVCELYIGLQNDAVIEEAKPYSCSKPIVYYGSSITQGGCASRPGNAYPAIVSRRFDTDFINLGFSGCGCGEQQIADYIASLDMKMFVFDYDHNAPNAEHLQKTHEKFFKTVRAANPDLPIIMMSAVTLPRFSDNRAKRREIIYNTYKNAKDSGDKNVYFLDGSKEFAPYEDFGTVEGCHPNDLGFAVMAKSLINLIEKII